MDSTEGRWRKRKVTFCSRSRQGISFWWRRHFLQSYSLEPSYGAERRQLHSLGHWRSWRETTNRLRTACESHLLDFRPVKERYLEAGIVHTLAHNPPRTSPTFPYAVFQFCSVFQFYDGWSNPLSSSSSKPKANAFEIGQRKDRKL